MFEHVTPVVLFMTVLVVAAFTFDISIVWKISWWLSGVCSAWVLSNFKGEDFGGGITRIVALGINGILGCILIPFALVALVLDYHLCFNIEEEWEKEARDRDRQLTER